MGSAAISISDSTTLMDCAIFPNLTSSSYYGSYTVVNLESFSNFGTIIYFN